MVSMGLLSAKNTTGITRRDALYARAGALRHEQRDFVAGTAAYLAKTVEIDAVLSEIWAMGPIPWVGDPE